jgi:cytochrome c-type biogenesis protein CcmH
MKRGALLLLLLVMAVPALAMDAEPPLPNPADQARYVAITRELRCLKCAGETVADTPAMFAVDIRRKVREMVQAGQSDEQIRQYMVDRYGEIILLRPRWSLRNAWLWLAPGVFLLGGVFIGWRVLSQRRALLDTDTDEVIDDEAART